MQTRVPTRIERLVSELSAAAIELQALAQRLANAQGLPGELRQHADELAQAGRVVALAARTANDGRNPHELMLFYGTFLSTSEHIRDRASPLAEAGYMPHGRPVGSLKAPRQDMTAPALAQRRATLNTA